MTSKFDRLEIQSIEQPRRNRLFLEHLCMSAAKQDTRENRGDSVDSDLAIESGGGLQLLTVLRISSLFL